MPVALAFRGVCQKRKPFGMILRANRCRFDAGIFVGAAKRKQNKPIRGKDIWRAGPTRFARRIAESFRVGHLVDDAVVFTLHPAKFVNTAKEVRSKSRAGDLAAQRTLTHAKEIKWAFHLPCDIAAKARTGQGLLAHNFLLNGFECCHTTQMTCAPGMIECGSTMVPSRADANSASLTNFAPGSVRVYVCDVTRMRIGIGKTSSMSQTRYSKWLSSLPTVPLGIDMTASHPDYFVARERIHAYSTRQIFKFLRLLITKTDSTSLKGTETVKAIDLLTAFSGERTNKFEPYFQFSERARIVSVEIHAVGTESTTARYTDEQVARKQVNNILRITTADGYEGISGVDTYHYGKFSDDHLIELKGAIADLLALQTLDPVEAGTTLTQTRPELTNETRSSIDIALWDLAACKAGLPLHEFLGSQRASIETYASLPFYDSLPEYVAAVNEYAELGFKTFKFHVWGQIDKDALLVDMIEKTYANTPFRFMIDFENAYDFDEALELGKAMNEKQFVWLEGPIDDALLEQYSELRKVLPMPIIPDGCEIYSAEFIRRGIEKKAWDAGRFDVTVVGGISKALELMIIANAAGLPVEIQSWGHSLSQVANLHLMLANKQSKYFEAPMPKQAFEFGMKNGNLLHKGQIIAPKGPGLGIEIDWDHLQTADFYVMSR